MHSNVVNRHGARVTTAVTNLDIHDIARSARTYELRRYFLVTPLAEQHELVGRILGHWQSKQSREYHPDRFEALSRVRLAWNFDEVRAGVEAAHGGKRAEVVLTDASELPGKVSVSYRDYRAELEFRSRKAAADGVEPSPVIVVFGTGWGISDAFHPVVDRILMPVYGPEGSKVGQYNHLSVRAAVAVILDRLLGT